LGWSDLNHIADTWGQPALAATCRTLSCIRLRSRSRPSSTVRRRSFLLASGKSSCTAVNGTHPSSIIAPARRTL
jgi:hypothetical protein